MEVKQPFRFSESFDNDFLNELFGDDLVYAITIFEGFLEEMPECCYRMRSAFESNDIAGMRSSAHKCKTLFSYIGLKKIAVQIEALEMACDVLDNTATMQPLFTSLLQQKEAIEKMVSDEINRLKQYHEA